MTEHPDRVAAAVAAADPPPRPRLGFISHVRAALDGASSRELYRDTIALAQHAERRGFHSFWVAQHHFGGSRSHLPSPLLLLTAIGEHTERIRLGTAVVVGSIEDPIRLAEDAAVADHLTGGRLELGLGAGADPGTAKRFGRDHAGRHDEFEANLGELLRLLDGPELVPTAPTLAQRIWIGTSSLRGYDLAARHGLGVLTGRTSSPSGPDDAPAARAVERYRASAAAAGHQPRVGMSRPVLAAASSGAAYDVLAAGIEEWVGTCRTTGRLPETFTARDYVETGHLYLGTGEEVLDGLRHDAVYPLSTDLLLNTQPSAPPPSAVRESMDRLAAALRADPVSVSR